MTNALRALAAAILLVAGCAIDEPVVNPSPPEVIAAAEQLRKNVEPGTGMDAAKERAEALGLLCYWGEPVDVKIAPKSLLLCSRSCDNSLRHGWWVALAADQKGRLATIEEAPMRSFAPRSCQPELRVLGGNGARAAVSQVAAQFAVERGYRVNVEFAVNAEARRLIEGGERFDVAIVSPPVLDALIAQGKVARETRAVIGRSDVAIGVRDGAPKPDLSSVDAVKQALLAAKSVVFAADGASGEHFIGLLKRLGIAEEMKPKLRPAPAQYTVEVVARGDAEMVVAAVSRLSGVRGVQLAGRLPQELQARISFAAGVARESKDPVAARELVHYLSRPETASILRDSGLEPFVE